MRGHDNVRNFYKVCPRNAYVEIFTAEMAKLYDFTTKKCICLMDPLGSIVMSTHAFLAILGHF